MVDVMTSIHHDGASMTDDPAIDYRVIGGYLDSVVAPTVIALFLVVKVEAFLVRESASPVGDQKMTPPRCVDGRMPSVEPALMMTPRDDVVVPAFLVFFAETLMIHFDDGWMTAG